MKNIISWDYEVKRESEIKLDEILYIRTKSWEKADQGRSNGWEAKNVWENKD